MQQSLDCVGCWVEFVRGWAMICTILHDASETLTCMHVKWMYIYVYTDCTLQHSRDVFSRPLHTVWVSTFLRLRKPDVEVGQLGQRNESTCQAPFCNLNAQYKLQLAFFFFLSVKKKKRMYHWRQKGHISLRLNCFISWSL